MTNENKYYIRAFKLLNQLYETYRNGFDKIKLKEFIDKQNIEGYNNSKILAERKHSLILTIIIAFIGLNKETIEKSETIDNYNDIKVFNDIRKEYFFQDTKKLLVDFDNIISKNDIFNNWLKIIEGPVDATNIQIMKSIRNGLLHSNFTFEMNSEEISFTTIKIKKYYKSKILNNNFINFAINYFSNCGGLSIRDKTTLLHFPIIKNRINNELELKEFLKEIHIQVISNKQKNYDGTNSLNMKLIDTLDKDNIAELKKLKKIIKEQIEQGNDINEECGILKPEMINYLITIINSLFTNFYKEELKDQIELIRNIICYTTNSKDTINNWLSHFYGVIFNIGNDIFDINSEYFKDDKYSNFCCFEALAILKSYLILYRLQNVKNNDTNSTKFDELQYDKINIDWNKNNIIFRALNKDNVEDNNIFNDLYSKKYEKYPEKTDTEIWNMVICEHIRNSLAHGNIDTFIDDETLEHLICFTDIDTKNKKTKSIIIPLKEYEIFLDSEAFLPTNCYKKEKTKKCK